MRTRQQERKRRKLTSERYTSSDTESSSDTSEEVEQKDNTPILEELKDNTPTDTETEEDEKSVLPTPPNKNRLRDTLLEQLKDQDLELYRNLKEVFQYQDEHTPNIIKIIKTPLLIADKAELHELYEYYRTLDPFSMDWIDMKKILNRKFKEAKKEYKREITMEKKQREELEQKKEMFESGIDSTLSVENQILSLNTSDTIKSVIFQEYKRFREFDETDDEKLKLYTWIQTVITLPFNNRCPPLLTENIEKFLLECREKLDKELYGLIPVKEQILIFLNARLRNKNVKECNLGLIGSPGTGKTKLASLISDCLNLPFAQINCGGLSDTTSLVGFSYTFQGAKPGAISTSLSNLKCKNGVLFFDEADKMSNRVNTLMLHVVDPNQNNKFVDLYFGQNIPIDLSELWLIFSMNQKPVDTALRDRIFFIELPKYTKKEKILILKNYSIPRLCRDIGLCDMEFPEETCKYIVDNYTENEEGMRRMDHICRDLIRKLYFQKTNPNISTSFSLKIPCDNSLFKITPEIVEKLVQKKQTEQLPMYT